LCGSGDPIEKWRGSPVGSSLDRAVVGDEIGTE
jgi:hypothetical protein